MSKGKTPKKSIATRSVRAGLESDAQHGSVVPPIYLSTNFAFEKYRTPRKYDYTRSGNPTRDQLANALADLEGGAGAVVTCTGLSAITLILATLPGGARVIAPYDCYGGTYRLLAALHAQGNLVVDFVDQGDSTALRAALEKGARLVWIETPSNPLLRVVDIRAITEAAHAVDALAVVDNTFLSPIWQQPLDLGADMVMHSTTKYLAGHPGVERVYYPGLPDHPGHDIARRQQSGFGAMLSFELYGGEAAVEAFLSGLECFTLAESLGGVESLIAHPVSMTHAGMEESARLRAGIGPGLLRVSVGIEDPADLVADLAAGLERAAKVEPAPHLRRHAS